MKYFIYSLLAIGVTILIFNLFQIDYSNMFGSESSGALISILASLCVIVMMLILLVSRKIQEKSKEQ